MNVLDQTVTDKWSLYNGDCVEVVSALPAESVGFSVFSPPFASLYTYTNSERDMGNCVGDEQFMRHFGFLIKQLFRVLKPGRLVSFHCMNMPATKERHGFIGLRDFRGDLIRAFESAGFIFASEVCIWKDPLVAMQRTKALGLLHKQIVKDSAMCRQGIPDYLVTMRKPGTNPEPITHLPAGFRYFIGENAPDGERTGNPKTNKHSHEIWQRYASPVWMDIDPGKTLQSMAEPDDERHICPLQLQVIARALELWSNPNDVILSPFAGIGSEGYVSILMGRRFVGAELKAAYYRQAVKNLRAAEEEAAQKTLIDGLEVNAL